jgi:uncharacterized protein YeaO (DUF488 family)
MPEPTQQQQIKDLQDFTVRLQKEINELKKQLVERTPTEHNSTDISDSSTFESRVWEACLVAAITSMNNNPLTPKDETIRGNMIHKVLRQAEQWVDVARKYREEMEAQKLSKQKELSTDPLKSLLAKQP